VSKKILLTACMDDLIDEAKHASEKREKLAYRRKATLKGNFSY
jgi:hypothetical protein